MTTEQEIIRILQMFYRGEIDIETATEALKDLIKDNEAKV